MKSTKILFLFFNFCILCFLANQKIFAQQEIDSTLFYRQLLKKPLDPSSLSSAYKFFDKHHKNSLLKGETLAAVGSLRYLASIENTLGSSYESEATSVKALKLLEGLNVNATIEPRTGIYNLLGIIYRSRKDYEKAIEFYDKVLELAQTQEQVNKVYLNKGNVYKDQGEYKLALDAFTKVYNNIKNSKNDLFIANSLDNIGYIQSKLNDPQALQNLEKALELKLKTNNLNKIYKSYSNLREYYKDRSDKEKALEYANKSYLVAKQINSSSYVFDALSHLIEFNDDEKIIEYKRLNDSIEDFKSQSKNKYAALKYEKETETKRADTSQRIKERWVLTSIVLGLLFTLIYSFQKSKHKKDKIKQAYFKETELSKKVHDELANDMSDLMNYVETDIETSQEKKTLLLDNLEDIYLRTRDISTETGSIDLVSFSESLSNLLLQHNREGTKVVINDINSINWENVPDYKKMIVYRCLQELMINMKKHSKAKLVSIVFKEQNNKKEIRYVDDGVGVSIEHVKLNGLLNVESRIKSIQGTFNFTTSKENGFKATLEFNS